MLAESMFCIVTTVGIMPMKKYHDLQLARFSPLAGFYLLTYFNLAFFGFLHLFSSFFEEFKIDIRLIKAC